MMHDWRKDMKRKLMVLGAGFPQVNLMNAAKELGYHTIVASIPGNYPGFDVADEIAYVDISNKEEVLKVAKEKGIDGVATCCLDTGIKALGYVCQNMNLVGLSEQAAECCNDKYVMKKAFAEYGVNSAKFLEVSSEETAVEASKEIGFPLVLKALDLQGSNGVFICNNEAEFTEAYKTVKDQSKLNSYIVEEFVSGYELGAQAFVYNGEILYILPHGDYTFMSKTAIPVGHYVPVDISADLEKEVLSECEKAIRALGLNNCAVNIDLIAKDGKIYVIELTGRAGATCLPELVSIYFGLDYYKMIAMTAMGEDPRPYFDARTDAHVANASHMLISEESGVVTEIPDLSDYKTDPDIYDLSLIVKEGDKVNKYTNAKDRIGQVIVKGDSYDACKEKLDTILEQVKVTVK